MGKIRRWFFRGFWKRVALDAQGNVYWTGDFVGSVNMGSTSLVSNGGGDLNGGGEIFVAKLDADGNYIWAVSGAALIPTNRMTFLQMMMEMHTSLPE